MIFKNRIEQAPKEGRVGFGMDIKLILQVCKTPVKELRSLVAYPLLMANLFSNSAGAADA